MLDFLEALSVIGMQMYDVMIKSQNGITKFLIFFILFFVSCSITAYCESPNEKLFLSDSLFDQKKYTQSFELYDEILKSDKKTSPAMLLKMAFIKQGLGDFTSALYYLNLYYLKTYNRKVLKKMEDLAKENKLVGYNYDDAEFFLNIYHQYQLQFNALVILLMLIFFGVIYYQKRNGMSKSSFPGTVYIMLLLVLLFINNYGREHSKAVIVSSMVYLMDGPSPGANVVEVVSNGHRVDIIGQDDVWVKIAWRDKFAYVKSFNLKRIKL